MPSRAGIEPGLADVDRPLAPRGRKAAPLIARYLREAAPDPRSGALLARAQSVRETWQLMAPVLGDAVACKTLRSLYARRRAGCSRRSAGSADEVRVLMVIGHNPGLGALAAEPRRRPGREKALQRLRTKFPTAGLAVLTFEVERWAELAAGGGRLEDFVRPRTCAERRERRGERGDHDRGGDDCDEAAVSWVWATRAWSACSISPRPAFVPGRRPAEPAARSVRARRNGWCCRAATAPSCTACCCARRPRMPICLIGFGGNGQDAELLAQDLAADFPDLQVAVFHYRGYGPSTGKPGEAALLADALDHLRCPE